jgi:hypothetical protein
VVYGSAHEEFKNEFLVELSSFCHEVDAPYIIGGDFNIIRHCGEKNKCTPLSRYSDVFNSIIHTLGLREIHMAGGLYTWSNKQKFPTMAKIIGRISFLWCKLESWFPTFLTIVLCCLCLTVTIPPLLRIENSGLISPG